MDIMEGARDEGGAILNRKGDKKKGRGGKEEPVSAMEPHNIVRQIKRLEAEMFKKARNLEFEEAARLRDEIERLKQIELGLPKTLVS